MHNVLLQYDFCPHKNVDTYQWLLNSKIFASKQITTYFENIKFKNILMVKHFALWSKTKCFTEKAHI